MRPRLARRDGRGPRPVAPRATSHLSGVRNGPLLVLPRFSRNCGRGPRRCRPKRFPPRRIRYPTGPRSVPGTAAVERDPCLGVPRAILG